MSKTLKDILGSNTVTKNNFFFSSFVATYFNFCANFTFARSWDVHFELNDDLYSHFSSFYKLWAIPGLFLIIFVFSIQFTINKFSIQRLPMTGFELRTSDIGSNRSTNWARHNNSPYTLLFILFMLLLICALINLFRII